MATRSASTAALSGGGGGGESSSSNRNSKSSRREGTAKAMVSDQLSLSILSTSNLLHLMQHTSPSQAQLTKLPKSLLAKTSTIKNTEQMLEQMPLVISSLDAHMESALQSVPHLKTVIQLLSNIESCQLKPLSKEPLSKEEPRLVGPQSKTS